MVPGATGSKEDFSTLTLLSCPPEPGQSFRSVSRIGRFSSWANGRIGAALLIWGMSGMVLGLAGVALVFSVLNAAVLAIRIRAENAALAPLR